MKNSNLKNILLKTSDYLFGLGANHIYDSSINVFNAFYQKDTAKIYTKSIKTKKIIKIATRNFINLTELFIIGFALTTDFDYSTTLPILGLMEFNRYALHRVNKANQEEVLKQKEEVLKKGIKQTKSLDEIANIYEGKNRGEEWKNK